MSTDTFKKAITGLTTNKVLLTIVTLSHPDWAEDIVMVDNIIPITSNGVTYLPYGFQFVPPSSTDSDPVAKISIDDIDRIVTKDMRSIIDKANVSVSVILSDDPDQIEMGPFNFVAVKADITGSIIDLSLEIETVLRNKLTGFNTSADYFPGLFL